MSDSPIPNTNDGSTAPPRLVRGISYITYAALPDWSVGPHGTDAEADRAVKAAGYEALQTSDPARARVAGLIPTGMMRVFDDLDEMREKTRRFRDGGCDCTTVHLGTGLESDYELLRLAEGLLEISEKEQHPIYLETHRATMTQDIRRTLDLVARLPQLRFNGDFAHWYIGHEFTYGDMEMKFAALAPIFERTRFLHLRVSSNAFGQVSASDPAEARHTDFYRRMWTASCAGFLRSAQPGDYLAVHPELLPARAFYPKLARAADGSWQEESDRWTEARLLIEIAEECFAAARAELAEP